MNLCSAPRDKPYNLHAPRHQRGLTIERMSVHKRVYRERLRSAHIGQRGAALLFAVLLVLLGTGIFMVSASQETVRSVLAERVLADNMKAAKEALVAYAVSHPSRPGAFPCPDTTDDGLADPEYPSIGPCASGLGRLPWRTLGVGDIRDTSGERYWYALSENFREIVAINSDSHGDRQVLSRTASVSQTNEAVAVIFAPGAATGGQVRDATTTACATTGTAIPRTLCAANYLDATAAADNAAPPPAVPTQPVTFIAADATDTFNDRLLAIVTSDVIPLVERRVASDLRRTLVQYREASRNGIAAISPPHGCNCYPWADSDHNGTSDVGQNRGRIPLTASPHNWGTTFTVAVPDPTKLYTIPNLPTYFQANNWHTVIHYTVGQKALQNFGEAPTLCLSCIELLPSAPDLKGTLSIDKNPGHAVVLITPGSAGANRPKGWTGNWGHYIDDAGNRDGDNRFVTPASKANDRDRLTTIPDDVPPASCAPNAQMLIRNAPCHTTGTASKPVCEAAVRNLQVCVMCSGQAGVMLDEPCRNTLNPPECQTAVAGLQGCKM